MGLLRKMTSVTTLGMVDFRSESERTASYTKATKKQAQEQTKLMRQQLEQQTQLLQQQQGGTQILTDASGRQFVVVNGAVRYLDGNA